MQTHESTVGAVAEDYFGALIQRARTSAAKASVKFPQPNYVTLKIAEEAGEVVRGAVHYAEGRMEWSEVEGEIVQLLAMLIRFVTEGDEINGVRPPALLTAAPEPPAGVGEIAPPISSTTAYNRDQLAKLAFAVFYSSNLCAPQNIEAAIKEIDTCGNDCEYAGSSSCVKAERGEFCPFSLAEDLRQVSAALFGPKDPSWYKPGTFGPDRVPALTPTAPNADAIRAEALEDVAAERERQKSVEGWTTEHDDQHRSGELAQAAAAYAFYCTDAENGQPAAAELWPTTWSGDWWKASADPRRNLVKAGALIVAEIERLDRAAIRDFAEDRT